MKLFEAGERRFLELVREWTAGDHSAILCGVGDDAAILASSGDREIAISTDAFLEGVHFTREIFSPEEIGHKVMAASLSDLAAVGAEPIAAFVSLFAPPETTIEMLRSIYRGMTRCASAAGAGIAGGDTTRGPLAFGITVVGSVPRGAAFRRDGAHPGDMVFVSGTLGKSEAGRLLATESTTAAVRDSARASAVRSHRTPDPRFDVARFLRRASIHVTSMIDVSDGLGIDLARICEASDAGCRIEEANIPVDEAAREIARHAGRTATDLALSGGEDFELLFTVSPKDGGSLEDRALQEGVVLRKIGTILPLQEGRSLARLGGELSPWPETGFDHFTREGGS